MRVLLAFCLILSFAASSFALEIAGVQVEPSVTVNNRQLNLNGSGLRKKFFVKVYIGSLYAAKKLTSGPEALTDSGDKLVRMQFLHTKVEKEKITEAFREGFANNSPELAGSPEVKRFLALFTADFQRGDGVDLFLGSDGSVVARLNGKVLGTIVSPRLARGILAIYLGDKPADEALKRGMLGKPS